VLVFILKSFSNHGRIVYRNSLMQNQALHLYTCVSNDLVSKL